MAEKKGRLTLYEDYLSEETKAELAARDAAKQAEAAKKKKDGRVHWIHSLPNGVGLLT